MSIGGGREHSKWQACGVGSAAPRASCGFPGEHNMYCREQQVTKSVPGTSDCLLAPISLRLLAPGPSPAFFPMVGHLQFHFP